jgi:uronate dehydrogenase
MSGGSLYGHVLITGAAGYLGAVLRKALREDGLTLRLSDRDRPADLLPGEEFVTADLASARDVARLMDGIEAVVHLGAYSVEGPWDEILQSNIVGTYNIFEAARQAGVKRIVFASTHHVVGYYRRDQTIDTEVPLRPDSRYAVSKVFGEALGRLYADKHGISVICQRIGVARPKPIHRRALRTWLSEDDFVQLTRRCLSVPDLHFRIVYGVSANTGAFWDNAEAAAALGFVPASDGADFTAEIEAAPDNENPIARLFQGGQFCGMEFDGDPDRIT